MLGLFHWGYMSAFKLVQKFEDRTAFPVRLNEVRDATIELGASDAIRFKDVEIEKDVLRGLCYRFNPLSRPYAEQEEWIDILYADSLEEDWMRLVVTKELVHILDKQEHTITTSEQLDDLVRRMALRPELRDPLTTTWAEASDRVGLFHALGILFPFAARQLIKEKYDAGHISDEMIAHRACIPLPFVAFIMSDVWGVVYDGLMRFCEGDNA